MNETEVYNRIQLHLNHEPTSDQQRLMTVLSDIVAEKKHPDILVINGYAGTGKTSTMGAYVKTLLDYKRKFMLMAPTGRAAKVLAGFTGRPAYTIHKVIYEPVSQQGNTFFRLMKNPYRNVQFIVDEASMISDEKIPGKNLEMRSLLDDLFEFVFEDPTSSIIFIGDVAQLPPVGSEESPALNQKYLKEKFDLKTKIVALQEVVRQDKESGILHNATYLRSKMQRDNSSFPVFSADFDDTVRVTGVELEEELESMYSRYGRDGVIFLCRSNKRANMFNQQIRNRIFFMEEELCVGDLLMIVRNNYFWLKNNKYADFIANGDIVAVDRIRGIEDKYGFRFADARIKIKDYSGDPELEVKLLLDCIHTETPSLNQADYKRLYHEISAEYEHLRDRRKIRAKVLKDPYFNALQVKFAYAVTCHKAQGGQWPAVFVDQGYLNDEMLNKELYRWLYTAITRSTKHLFLVNFLPAFFGEEEF